jgi:hypothetical protein
MNNTNFRFGTVGVAGRRLGGGATIIVGVVWLAVSLLVTFMFAQNDAHAGDATTIGTVTTAASYIDTQNHRQCSPQAQFTVNGVTYDAASAISTNTCPRIGSKVTVIYDPANPASTGRIAAPGWVKIMTWGFSAIGVLIILSGVWMLIKRFASRATGASVT